MAHLHQQFYSGKPDEAVCIRDHLAKVAALTIDSFGASQRIQVISSGDDICMNFDVATPLSLLTTEIVSNSCKHAYEPGEHGRISVDVKRDDGDVTLQVGDFGRGFDTALTDSMGIRLLDSFAAQLNGRLDKITGPSGTIYSLQFAAAPLSHRVLR